MAKNKKKEEALNVNVVDLLKDTGGVSFSNVGKVNYFIDTGNLALNWMSSGKFIGGGFPGGKITEIFGPPATSKSLLGLCALASCQRMQGVSILLDCERAGNAEFAKQAAHVNPDSLVVYEPDSIEEVERKVLSATKMIREHYDMSVPICFLWDSIAVSPTEREWNTTKLPEKYTQKQFKDIVGSQERPGERARAAGDFLRKINPFLSNNNASLIVINQVRQKIGVIFGSDEAKAGGGMAMPFYISIAYRTSASKRIEDTNGLPMGVNLRFTNMKCRTQIPHIKTEGVQLFFSAGINPLGGLLSVLIKAKRVKLQKPGWYEVIEPYNGGTEHVFQSSQTRNDVPLDTILKCPLLIDGSSEGEVLEYLNPFMHAINLATGNAIVEKDVPEDEAGE